MPFGRTLCERCVGPDPTGPGPTPSASASVSAAVSAAPSASGAPEAPDTPDDYFLPAGTLAPVRVTVAPSPKRRRWPLVTTLVVVVALVGGAVVVLGGRDDAPDSAAADPEAEVIAPPGAGGSVSIGDALRLGSAVALEQFGITVQMAFADSGDFSTLGDAQQLQAFMPEYTFVDGQTASAGSKELSVQTTAESVVAAVEGGPGVCEYLRADVATMLEGGGPARLSLRTDAPCTAAGAPADGWTNDPYALDGASVPGGLASDPYSLDEPVGPLFP